MGIGVIGRLYASNLLPSRFHCGPLGPRARRQPLVGFSLLIAFQPAFENPSIARGNRK